jgi:hypothetical protein
MKQLNVVKRIFSPAQLGAQFERRASARPIFLWTYLRFLPHMYGIIAQIMSTSLSFQIFGLGTPL